MNMQIYYASSHIDGGLDCSSLEIGLLRTHPEAPITKVMVIAGLQVHPIWAINRLAVVIYCYVISARKHYPKGPIPIQVNLRGSLVSNQDSTCIIADSICWHTSEPIRAYAEKCIADLTSSRSLTDNWPGSEEMNLPFEPLPRGNGMDRTR